MRGAVIAIYAFELETMLASFCFFGWIGLGISATIWALINIYLLSRSAI